MKFYWHPSVGVYAKRVSISIQPALAAGALGSSLGATARSKMAVLGLGGLLGGIVGLVWPQRVLSWLAPPPPIDPKVEPPVLPEEVTPSFIGEPGLLFNAIPYLGQGNLLHDWSGGRVGSIQGPEWVSGSFGWALRYKGDGGVVFPKGTLDGDYGALSVEAWVLYQEPGDGRRDMGVIGRGTRGFGLTIDKGRAMFYIRSGDNLFAAPISPGLWHHLVGVFDGETMSLFVDGSPATNALSPQVKVKPSKYPSTGSGGEFALGVNPVNGSALVGLIGEARVWGRALSEEEVGSLYALKSSLYGGG